MATIVRRSEHVPERPIDCLLVASSGGHLLQLVELRDEWPADRRYWVTFDKPDARCVVSDVEIVAFDNGREYCGGVFELSEPEARRP